MNSGAIPIVGCSVLLGGWMICSLRRSPEIRTGCLICRLVLAHKLDGLRLQWEFLRLTALLHLHNYRRKLKCKLLGLRIAFLEICLFCAESVNRFSEFFRSHKFDGVNPPNAKAQPQPGDGHNQGNENE